MKCSRDFIVNQIRSQYSWCLAEYERVTSEIDVALSDSIDDCDFDFDHFFSVRNDLFSRCSELKLLLLQIGEL